MIQRPRYIDKLLTFIDTPFVKILTGVRRSGKSTLLKMFCERLKERGVSERQVLFYNFDSLVNQTLLGGSALYLEVSQRLDIRKKTYLFFDEIQEVAEWEKVVNSLMLDFDVDIYVTGSNSRMLSSEISTYLTGRYIQFSVFPLSFKEYLDFRNEIGGVDTQYESFLNYIKMGGFPAIHLQDYSLDEAYTIINDIYNSAVFADIIKRNQIRKIDQFERIVRFVFENVGNTFSAASIAKYLKSERRVVDNETVYNYLTALEKAYIVYRCNRYDLQGKEILKTQEKFYLCDSGIRFSVLGYTPNSIAAMLENVVYLELLRRGYDVFIGKMGDLEVDFVATKQNKKLYIQIAQRIVMESTENREYKILASIQDNYPKIVLVLDNFTQGNYQGIETINIADFLLDDDTW